MINDKNKEFLASFGSPKIAQKIYDNDEDGDYKGAVVRNPALNDSQLDYFVHRTVENPRRRQVIFNHSLKPHHYEKLLAIDNEEINYNLAKNPNLPKHHLDRFVDSDDDIIHSAVAKNPSLQPYHIDILISNYDQNKLPIHEMVRHQKLNSRQIDQVIDKTEGGDIEDQIIRGLTIQKQKLESHHFEKLRKDSSDYVRRALKVKYG